MTKIPKKLLATDPDEEVADGFPLAGPVNAAWAAEVMEWQERSLAELRASCPSLSPIGVRHPDRDEEWKAKGIVESDRPRSNLDVKPYEPLPGQMDLFASLAD